MYEQMSPIQGVCIPQVVDIHVGGYVVLAVRAFGRSVEEIDHEYEDEGGINNILSQMSKEDVNKIHESIVLAVQKMVELGAPWFLITENVSFTVRRWRQHGPRENASHF